MTSYPIIPPYLLENLERSASSDANRDCYRRTRTLDQEFRSRPATPVQPRPTTDVEEPREPSGTPDRIVYDAQNGTELPGTQVRAEGEPAGQDAAVNEAYDGTGATWAMFSECFGRDSIDDAGMQLKSTVHYDENYANAFWDGNQMVFGDGDGEIFKGFTSSIDITGHELAHGVTQHTANLEYQGQSGALNESVSDVFGSLTKQHANGESAADADWIIGEGIFAEGVNGVGLRSMKDPGTAYDDPRLGKDPQPGHMDDYVETTEDNGGVHINSGIPNKAFYLTATELGGNAYDDAGKIWYHTLTEGNLSTTADFAEFAQATQDSAKELYGEGSPQLAAVTSAWQQVGVQAGGASQEGPGSEQQVATDVSKFTGQDAAIAAPAAPGSAAGSAAASPAAGADGAATGSTTGHRAARPDRGGLSR